MHPSSSHGHTRRGPFALRVPAKAKAAALTLALDAALAAHLASVKQDALRGRVVGEVEPGEEVVDGVEVEPQVDTRPVEGQVHCPVTARAELRLTPVARTVARVDVMRVLAW